MESPEPSDICAKFSWNWSSVLEKILKFCQCMFTIYYYFPFIWTNLNQYYPRLLYAIFCWNWPCGYGKEVKIVKSSQTNRQTDRHAVDGRHDIRTVYLSFQLGWVKRLQLTLIFHVNKQLFVVKEDTVVINDQIIIEFS